MTRDDRPSTIVVLADNTLATLNRMISVLRARRFNVLSITPARTPTADLQGISIVIGSSLVPVQRIVACLDKIEEVRAVRTIEGGRAVCRELMLLKVGREAASTGLLADMLRDGICRVIDDGGSAVIVEIVGEPAALDRAVDSLPGDAVRDLARIGPATVWCD